MSQYDDEVKNVLEMYRSITPVYGKLICEAIGHSPTAEAMTLLAYQVWHLSKCLQSICEENALLSPESEFVQSEDVKSTIKNKQ